MTTRPQATRPTRPTRLTRCNRLTWLAGLAVAMAALFAVAACGDDDGTRPPEQPAGATVSGSWIATSGTVDGRPVDLSGEGRITLVVDGSSVGGRSACNTYGGEADFADGSVTFGALSWTAMGCAEPLMALEQAYLGSLAAIDGYTVDGDTLTLTGGAAGAAGTTEWVFTRQPPVVDVALAGSAWRLDTLVEGETAMHSVEMEAAFLAFEPGGGVTGSTGCRSVTGTWSGGDGGPYALDLAVVDDPAAGVCTPESQALDDRIAPVLGDVVEVAVAGSRLTLTGPAGTALSYVAT